MTYYELVSYLDSLIKKPIDNNNIEQLNNADIKLENERYQRFCEQLGYLVSERINIIIEKFKDALITEYLEPNTLALHVSNYKNEIKYCLNLCKCSLVKVEDQSEFAKSVIETNNSIVDAIITYFDDDERIEIINSLYIKEENNEVR